MKHEYNPFFKHWFKNKNYLIPELPFELKEIGIKLNKESVIEYDDDFPNLVTFSNEDSNFNKTDSVEVDLAKYGLDFNYILSTIYKEIVRIQEIKTSELRKHLKEIEKRTIFIGKSHNVSELNIGYLPVRTEDMDKYFEVIFIELEQSWSPSNYYHSNFFESDFKPILGDNREFKDNLSELSWSMFQSSLPKDIIEINNGGFYSKNSQEYYDLFGDNIRVITFEHQQGTFRNIFLYAKQPANSEFYLILPEGVEFTTEGRERLMEEFKENIEPIEIGNYKKTETMKSSNPNQEQPNFKGYLQNIWNSSDAPRFRGCSCGRLKDTHIVKSFLEVRNPITDGVGRVNENDINDWSNKFGISKDEVKEIIIETVKEYFNITEIYEYCRVPMFGCQCARNIPPYVVDSKTGKRI